MKNLDKILRVFMAVHDITRVKTLSEIAGIAPATADNYVRGSVIPSIPFLQTLADKYHGGKLSALFCEFEKLAESLQ